MKKTRRTTAQIIRILREAEGRDLKVEEICRQHNISSQNDYRWESTYGGLDVKEAQRLQDLEEENTELKKLLAVAIACFYKNLQRLAPLSHRALAVTDAKLKFGEICIDRVNAREGLKSPGTRVRLFKRFSEL